MNVRLPLDVERFDRRPPRRWVYVLVGFTLGFIAGCALVLLMGVHRSWGLM
jgi:hypothetical protein